MHRLKSKASDSRRPLVKKTEFGLLRHVIRRVSCVDQKRCPVTSSYRPVTSSLHPATSFPNEGQLLLASLAAMLASCCKRPAWDDETHAMIEANHTDGTVLNSRTVYISSTLCLFVARSSALDLFVELWGTCRKAQLTHECLGSVERVERKASQIKFHPKER